MSEDLRIQLLEAFLVKDQAVGDMIAGAQMVQQGGIPGIVDAANKQPDMILDVIFMLTTVIQQQRDELKDLMEKYLKLIDKIEEVTDL